jgi:hypothetical protein
MTSLRNAENAVKKGSVLVATVTVSPTNAQAPTGKGCSTRPAVTATHCFSSASERITEEDRLDHRSVMLVRIL